MGKEFLQIVTTAHQPGHLSRWGVHYVCMLENKLRWEIGLSNLFWPDSRESGILANKAPVRVTIAFKLIIFFPLKLDHRVKGQFECSFKIYDKNNVTWLAHCSSTSSSVSTVTGLSEVLQQENEIVNWRIDLPWRSLCKSLRRKEASDHDWSLIHLIGYLPSMLPNYVVSPKNFML